MSAEQTPTPYTIRKPQPARFPAYTVLDASGNTVATFPIMQNGTPVEKFVLAANSYDALTADNERLRAVNYGMADQVRNFGQTNDTLIKALGNCAAALMHAMAVMPHDDLLCGKIEATERTARKLAKGETPAATPSFGEVSSYARELNGGEL